MWQGFEISYGTSLQIVRHTSMLTWCHCVPSSGKEGIVLLDQNYPPLKSEMDIWINKGWKPIFAPLPVTDKLGPIPICSENLNMNMFSISETCVVIEECETPMYNFLSELGFDVIGFRYEN